MINEIKFLKAAVYDLQKHVKTLEDRIEKLKRLDEKDWTGYDLK